MGYFSKRGVNLAYLALLSILILLLQSSFSFAAEVYASATYGGDVFGADPGCIVTTETCFTEAISGCTGASSSFTKIVTSSLENESSSGVSADDTYLYYTRSFIEFDLSGISLNQDNIQAVILELYILEKDLDYLKIKDLSGTDLQGSDAQTIHQDIGSAIPYSLLLGTSIAEENTNRINLGPQGISGLKTALNGNKKFRLGLMTDENLCNDDDLSTDNIARYYSSGYSGYDKPTLTIIYSSEEFSIADDCPSARICRDPNHQYTCGIKDNRCPENLTAGMTGFEIICGEPGDACCDPDCFANHGYTNDSYCTSNLEKKPKGYNIPVSQQVGIPFFLTSPPSSNPASSSSGSGFECLASLDTGESCEQTWTVNVDSAAEEGIYTFFANFTVDGIDYFTPNVTVIVTSD